MSQLKAHASLDRGASEQEIEAVRGVLREIGIEAQVRASYVQKSQIPPWIVIVGVPVGLFLKSFAEEAGKDAWKALRDWVLRMYAARSSSVQPKGTVQLLDSGETRLQIILTDDLPNEAYEKLLSVDLSTFRHGPIYYDKDRGMWFSPIDKQLGRRRLRTELEEDA